MSVINPHYDDPIKAFAQSKAATIDSYLANRPGQKSISFDQLRADFPNVADPKTGAAPMTDGTLAAIFEHLGYQVEG